MNEYIERKAARELFRKEGEIAEYKGVIRLVVPVSIIDKLLTANVIEVDKFASKIAGHSYYHGDKILARLYCLKEGQKIEESIEPADVVAVVRCQDCAHAEPLDRNCEISTSLYMHCKLWRGDHTRNVWHKYKKYYKDYSLVMRDGYCSDGEKMDGKGDAK